MADEITERYTHTYRALANPLRRKLLAYLLVEREGSPKELSEVLGANFKRVYEDMQSLLRGGLIQLSGTDHRKGGTIHIYVPTDLASRFAGLLAEELKGGSNG
jgi:predicted transcriptional regulator